MLVIRTKQFEPSKGRVEEKEQIVMSPTGTPDSPSLTGETPAHPFLSTGTSPNSPYFYTVTDAQPVLKRSGHVLSSSSKDDLLKGLDMEKIERMRSPSPRSERDSATSSSSSTIVHCELVEEIVEAMQDDNVIVFKDTSEDTSTNEKSAGENYQDGSLENIDGDAICLRNTTQEITNKYNDSENNKGGAVDEKNASGNNQEGVTNKSDAGDNGEGGVYHIGDDDLELTPDNLVRLSSTGGAARLKVKKFVESMINANDDDKDDDDELLDMNQVDFL